MTAKDDAEIGDLSADRAVEPLRAGITGASQPGSQFGDRRPAFVSARHVASSRYGTGAGEATGAGGTVAGWMKPTTTPTRSLSRAPATGRHPGPPASPPLMLRSRSSRNSTGCLPVSTWPSTTRSIGCCKTRSPISMAAELEDDVRRARLDAELVRRGLARSRNQAAELVIAGRVTVGGQVATKAATAIGPDDPLRVVPDADEPAYVSRGG